MNENYPLIPQFITDKMIVGHHMGTFTGIALLVDITGSTQLTEQLIPYGLEGAEYLTRSLNEVFTYPINLVNSTGGFIASFGGDSFLALYEAKKDLSKLETTALFVAEEIKEYFEHKATKHTLWGEFAFSVKISIASGQIDWGIVGSKSRLGWYFKGEAVETAANVLSQIIEPIEPNTLLVNLKSTKKSSKSTSSRSDLIPEFSPEAFSGKEVLGILTEGEFRPVISVFISFSGISTYEEIDIFYKKIASLSTKFQGYLSKIEFGDKGARVVLFWGTPKASENDPFFALEFLSELQEELTSILMGVTIKAGASYGIVFAGKLGSEDRFEHTAIGDTVNVAARLMEMSSIEEILTNTELFELGKRFFSFSYKGLQHIKGKSNPQPVFQLQERLPHPKAEKFFLKLFGRKDELDEIYDAVCPIFSKKNAGLYLIKGVSGIGKTRLITALRDKLWTEGKSFSWFSTTCDPILSTGFYPFLAWLKQYMGFSENVSSSSNKIKAYRSLQQLINNYKVPKNISQEVSKFEQILLGFELELAEPDSLYYQIDPKSRRDNWQTAICTLFKAEASISPTILVIDDAHYIDDASLELLKLILHSTSEFPIFIVCAMRPGYREADKHIREEGFEIKATMELGPLANDDMVELVKATLGGGDLSDDLKVLLNQQTGNNPLFLEQLSRHLSNIKVIKLKDGVWYYQSKRFSLPQNLQLLLLARLDSLQQKVRTMLQIASVIGKSFRIDILKEIWEQFSQENLQDTDEIEELCSIAEKEAIVALDQEATYGTILSYTFTHYLLQETAYNMLSFQNRRHIHEVVLKVLEEQKEDARESSSFQSRRLQDLARHAEQSGNKIKAKLYLEKAALKAAEIFQVDEALFLYEQLLPQLDEGADVVQVQLAQIELLRQKGRYSEGLSLATDALSKLQTEGESADQYLLCSLLNEVSKLYRDQGDLIKWGLYLNQHYQLALELGDTDLLCQSFDGLGRHHLANLSLDDALGFFRRQLHLAQTGKNKEMIIKSYRNIGNTLFMQEDYEASLENYQKSLLLSEHLPDRRGFAASLCNLAGIFMKMGKMEQSLDNLLQAYDIFTQIGDKKGTAIVLANLGKLHKDYDLGRAKQLLEESLSIRKEIDDKRGIAKIKEELAKIYIKLGDIDNAADNVDQALSIWMNIEDLYHLASCYMLRGIIYFNTSNYKAAHECYTKGLHIFTSIKDTSKKAYALEHLSRLSLVEQNLLEAISYLDQSIANIPDKGNEKDLARLLFIRARILLLHGSRDLSRSDIKRGITLSKEINDEDLYRRFQLLEDKIIAF
ncbi:MAG: tetratricopeptide repeat protein [Candidatus Coatesbacteria bacterium]|nr:tetratricopeptide repeat protein [Candidatus Coatesbacteria bacterium]